MTSKKELKEIIAAWPDENGVSSDPSTYNAWMESEKKQFWRLARQFYSRT